MKHLTLILAVLMILVVGTPTASADTPEAAFAQEMIKFSEHFKGDDCAAITQKIASHDFSTMQELVKVLEPKYKGKSDDEMPQEIKQAMEQMATTMLPTMQKCQGDEAFMDAMKKFEQALESANQAPAKP